MATIPIEIVLQDADSPVDPTPTPENGEDTNIVVPNTGTISNDGNNSGGISSSIGIILPIVIAILAIVTVIVLIVRKHYRHHKRFSSVMSRKEKLVTVVSSTIAILAVTVLVGNLVIPATNAATSVAPGTAELETADKITITATREADSDNDTITATVKNTSYATANLDFGYKVTASMAEGLTDANLYLDGDETSEYYISPVADGTLADNTWGYTLAEPTEESSYLSLPLSAKPTNIVKEVAKTAEDKPVDIYYTVQIDKDMPNGTYTGELEYTLSPAIEYMQDFSTLTPAEKTATLTNMPEGKQYILKDSRDNKPYYISKLADNNVWMTQNLDLDLISDPTAEEYVALTPANTNISSNWTPANSTVTAEGDSFPDWQNNNYLPYSADPGDVYYYTSNTDGSDIKYNSLTECEVAGHTDCAHYHAGNYYNWSAAVATNDTSEYGDDDQYVNVETSICPAGWRLPTGRQSDDAPLTDNGLGTLVNDYDILGESHGCGGTCVYYDYAEGGLNKIRTAPLWLARFGGVYNGSLFSPSYYGYYWSSTVSSSSSAYYLEFGSGNVLPANGNGRVFGYSVRCIAQ